MVSQHTYYDGVLGHEHMQGGATNAYAHDGIAHTSCSWVQQGQKLHAVLL